MSAASTTLPAVGEVLAVCAHPDDESFGLGAVLAAFSEGGARVRVVCFTHGEASTLGAVADLRAVRANELDCAASVLGVTTVTLLDHPDGRLDQAPLAEMENQVVAVAGDADLFVGFDTGGITGHPDHVRATEAALGAAGRLGRPVLGWVLPNAVAAQLNAELGTAFVGREAGEVGFVVAVDRARQGKAIACHQSQSTDNPVLWRRLELLGGHEHLRWLTPPGQTRSVGAT